MFVFLVARSFGIVIGVCSSDWFGMWFGMEVNMLSFVPVMGVGQEGIFSEATVKYFVVQCLSSVWFLCGVSMNLLGAEQYGDVAIALGLLTKAGVPPFHFWYPGVMIGTDWAIFFLLSTSQKVVPVLGVCLLEIPWLMAFVVVVGGVISGVGGNSVSNLRGIFAYSSMNHFCWVILGSIGGGWKVAMDYFAVYYLSMVVPVFFFWATNVSSVATLGQSYLGMPERFGISSSIMSLAGMPPFLGFIPKWFVVYSSVDCAPFSVGVLLMSSVLHMGYYFQIIWALLGGSRSLCLYWWTKGFCHSFRVDWVFMKVLMSMVGGLHLSGGLVLLWFL